jgi:trigger factor
MRTTVEPLEDSRVKLRVDIPADVFESAVDEAFAKLGADVKVPGFRPGKVPRRVLEQRLGTGAAREQALRDSLPRFYAEAVMAEGVDAIAAPQIEIVSGEDTGDVTFEAVVEIRPHVKIKGYRGLRVVLADPTVGDDEVRQQVDRLREQFADLEESPTPLTDGDFAQIDLKGYAGEELVEGLSASDFLYEVGSGILLPKLDEELRGQRPGGILEFSETLPEHFGERAGEVAKFRVLVKEAKRKVLPDLSDEWVQDASEFETVTELEADVRRRLETVRKVQAQIALRDHLLEAAADLVPLDAPEPLVQQEIERRLHDLLHRLEERGATLQEYLEASGTTQQDLVARVQEGANRAVKADLALRAVVEQEAIEVDDGEMEAEIARLAERVGRKPDEVRGELDHGGGLQAVRSEVARGKALQLLVDHSVVVDDAGNEIDLSLPEPGDDEQSEPATTESPA